MSNDLLAFRKEFISERHLMCRDLFGITGREAWLLPSHVIKKWVFSRSVQLTLCKNRPWREPFHIRGREFSSSDSIYEVIVSHQSEIELEFSRIRHNSRLTLLMVDPEWRNTFMSFSDSMQSANGLHLFTDKILKIKVQKIINEVGFDVNNEERDDLKGTGGKCRNP